MVVFRSRTRLLTSTLIAGAAASLASPAFAQDQVPADQAVTTTASQPAEPGQGEIVVTGSRIARPELDSASPIAVVGSEQIQAQGITNTQDLLQKLPQVGIPGFSKTNTNFATTGNGIASINLRNLGSSRTLVLVNGRRFVPGVAGTSIVDVNNIPADFVDRIEVVTGGASAVYGSDAISGVVNYVLKDHIDGIVGRAQYGISDRGDNRNYSLSLSGGQTFGPDSRGSIIGNFTYTRDYGLLSRNRKISAQDCLYICGPSAYSSFASQGRFLLQGVDAEGADPAILTDYNGAPTDVFTFDPNNNLVDGEPVPLGYGFNRNGVRRISVPVTRYLGAISAKYDFSDHVTAFLEGTYAKTKSSSQIEANPFGAGAGNA